MHEIHIRQHFACPPEQVFDVFHRHHRLAEVYPARFTRVRDGDGDDPDGAGSVREIRSPGVCFREQVTRCEVPALIEYRIIAGMKHIVHHRGEMHFIPQAQGTLLDYRIEVAFRGPMDWVGGRLMGAMVRSRMRRLARRLGG